MNKNIKSLSLLFLVLILAISSCQKSDNRPEIDELPPVIDLSGEAFPVQCSVLKRGGTFTFRARFSDHVALGSYSLDVHHNFDHHSHSTEFEACNLFPKKTPVKPFVLIKSYPIPAGQKTYEAIQEIHIPADIDSGDYHFLISLTDGAGWSTIKGLSIQIIE